MWLLINKLGKDFYRGNANPKKHVKNDELLKKRNNSVTYARKSSSKNLKKDLAKIKIIVKFVITAVLQKNEVLRIASVMTTIHNEILG